MKKQYKWMNNSEAFEIPQLQSVTMREYLDMQRLRLKANQQVQQEFNLASMKDVLESPEINAYHADLANLKACAYILQKIDDTVTEDQIADELEPVEIAEICVEFYNIPTGKHTKKKGKQTKGQQKK